MCGLEQYPKEQKCHQHFPYGNEDQLLYDFKETFEQSFESHLIARQIPGGGIFICLHGEAEILIDLKSYRLNAGDVCIVFPYSILQTVSKSDDFERFIIGINTTLVQEIQLPSATDYFLYIKENPCISLEREELNKLLELCDLMMQQYAIKDHPFRDEIARSMFRVVYFEIASIYTKRNPIVQEYVPRKDSLTRQFMYLLAKHHNTHRDVEFYANELCVTPRYLSAVVKERTGGGALSWINSLVIKQAKSLLRDNRLSVMQVSDQLNFANPSFFGQYFKKHTGMTPKGFRDEAG